MTNRRDFDKERARFEARLKNEKDTIVSKFAPPSDNTQLIKSEPGERNHITNSGLSILGQPLDVSSLAPGSYHHIGTLQIATSREALETAARLADTPLIVWGYDEYLYALRSVDGWKRTWETHDEAVKRWEHSEREARERYDHQERAALDNYFLSKADEPHYKEPYKPLEKPQPDLKLDAPQIMFVRSFSRAKNTPNLDGYLAYIRDQSEQLYFELLREFPAYVLENKRVMHTYIVGGSGSGKSELMKSIIHSYVIGRQAAAVVLDPNGDFAGQIARWHEFTNNPQLIYLEYNLELGQTFTINPFEISGISPLDKSRKAVSTRVVVANQLQDAFVQIVAGGSGGDEFSTNMKALLMPCITALLELPGATILDLQRFMNDDENSDLLEFAKSLDHYENNVIFFETEFNDKSYSPTKKAVAKKIRSLLNFPAFGHLTCGKSTVDLELSINQKKAIIFNIANGRVGEAVTGAFGRLVVSMIQGIALRREDVPKAQRVPCHLFLDECHHFISPSIEKVMTEARKYGLHLTMAQQAIGYRMGYALKELVKINSKIKISGEMPKSAWKATADYIGADDSEDFRHLKKGRYIMAADPTPPVMFSGRVDLLDNKNCVSGRVWNLTKKQQLRFYRSYDLDTIVSSDIPAPTVKQSQRKEEKPLSNRMGFDILPPD